MHLIELEDGRILNLDRIIMVGVPRSKDKIVDLIVAGTMNEDRIELRGKDAVAVRQWFEEIIQYRVRPRES